MYRHIIVILCLFTGITKAQNCQNKLSGYIIDLHDQTPLMDATIIIAGAETAVNSDKNGRFEIKGLCDATYTLQIAHEACKTQVVRIVVRGDTERNINMEHHLEDLGEVSITGKSYQNATGTGIEQTVSEEVLQINSAGSLGDALTSLSGVTSLNTGSTIVKPVIQGLHSSRVVLINDGSRLQDQEWGVEHAPSIDINSAGNVSVVKGASALQYGGDAVGGTIIIKPRWIALSDSLFGKTRLTGASNGRGGSFTANITKSYNSGWYGNLQGTLKRFGDFEAPDYNLSNTGVSERNLKGRIGINTYAYGIEASYSIFNTNLGILRASHVGNSSDLATAINSDQPIFIEPFTYTINAPRQEIKHQTAILKGYKRFDGIGKVSFQYDYQKNNRLEFDIRRDSDDLRPTIDLELSTHTAIADFEYTSNNTMTLKAGILGRLQTNFPDPKTGVRRLIPDYDRTDFGIYTLGSKTLNQWTLEAGIRYDYNFIDTQKFYRQSFWEARGYDQEFNDLIIEDTGSQFLINQELNFHNISATVGASYDFSELYSISANYALASRAPNPSELYSDGLHQSAARIEIGDLRFDQERSNKIGVTLSRKHENWSFQIAPFINLINDFIVLEPTGSQNTLRGEFPIWEYRQTNARIAGIDFDNTVKLASNISLSNQLSFIKGQDTDLDLPLINIPAVNTRNRVSYTNPKWNNFNIWLESYYVFEQNEFPDTNFDIFIPLEDTFIEADASTPPEAYHLLSLRSQMDFTIINKNDLSLAFGVNNIFDVSYRDYLNRLRFYADDLGRNFTMQATFNF